MILNQKSTSNSKLFLSTRKYFVAALCLFWASGAILFMVTKNQIKTIISTRELISKNQAQLSKLTQKKSDLDQVKISQQFQHKEKVDQVLPSHKPLLELLNGLSQSAKSAEINITEFEISPGKIASESAALNKTKVTKAEYQALELQLGIEGNLASLEKFLNLVERITPLTTITDFSINRHHERSYNPQQEKLNGQTKEFIKAKADMILNSYYYTKSIETTLSSQLPSIGKKEIEAFNTIQEFIPANFSQPSEIQGGEVEDLFNIDGFEQL